MTFLKSLMFFVLLSALSLAVSSEYKNYFNVYLGYPDSFKGDVSVTNAFTISASSGSVLSGTASDLASGSVICPNTKITVQPSVTGTYKVTSIYGPYPSGAPKPAACSGGGTTHSIKWLSSSTFNSVKTTAKNNNDFSTNSADLNSLGGTGSFYDECNTFDDGANLYTSASGRARIFGKGTIVVKDGTTTFLTTTVDSPASGSTTLVSVGSHSIISSLSSVDTLPVVDTKNTGSYFAMNYYSYNAPTLSATTTKTITVKNSQNSITCATISPASPITITTGKNTIAAVTITNTGDVPTAVTGVTSSNTAVTAKPFDTKLCGTSVPSTNAACGGNGFNSSINPGLSKTIYIMLSSSATSGTVTTTLKFTYSSSPYNACNGMNPTTPCSLSISAKIGTNGGTSVTNCTITPSSTNVYYKQKHDFTLQCRNSSNSVVSCGTVKWAVSGLSSIFFSNSSTGASIGVYSSVGSKGTLKATIGNVSCSSNLTVVTPTCTMDIKPDSASLNIGNLQYFNTSCTSGSGSVACSNVQWDPTKILVGTLSGSSDSGTNYTATAQTSTQLVGIANGLCTSNPPFDISQITVSSTVTPVANCSITPNPANVYYKQVHSFNLSCVDSSNTSISCGSVTWAVQNLQHVFFSKSSTGATLGVHSSVGSKGTLTATIGSISCASNLTVVAPTQTLNLDPDSAKLKLNDTQNFTTACTSGGVAVSCPTVQWDPFSNLTGTLSGTSNTGTLYTATVDNVTTQLWAVATGFGANPPYDWSDIVVGTGSGGGGGGGGGAGSGESEFCAISPSNSTAPYGYNHFTVKCKASNGALINCTSGSIKWQYNSGTVQSGILVPNTFYVMLTQTGTLTAYTNYPKEFCSLDITSLSKGTCLDYT